MTNTIDRKSSRASKSAGRESAVGLQKHKRTPIDIGLALITPIVGQEFLDKHNLRDPLNSGLKLRRQASLLRRRSQQPAVQAGVPGRAARPTRLKASGADYFDLTPDDDQKMIVETVNEFAEEVLRPAAREADETASYPTEISSRRPTNWGSRRSTSPRTSTGFAEHRAAVTNALVAEALAYGDMGLALPILAPAGVASALTHWGSADQQATYLKEFAGENVPQACLAIAEPHPLFDPTSLKTTAVRTPSGYRLDGVKSLVVAAKDAELFVRRSAIERQARAVHRRVVVEGPDRQTRSEHGNPCCGTRSGRTRPRFRAAVRAARRRRRDR